MLKDRIAEATPVESRASERAIEAVA